jgi:RecA/RadA recombinase
VAKKKTDTVDTTEITKVEKVKGGLSSADLLAMMKKEFKDQSVTMLSSENQGGVTDWADSGICVINYVMTGDLKKGMPFGRTIEWHGSESTGKTLIALYQAREVQKQGGIVLYIDSECSLSRDFAERLQVDVSSMLYDDKIKKVEEFQAKLDQLVKIKYANNDKTPTLVILDSLGILSTNYEEENMQGSDRTKGREMKKMFRRLNSDMHKTNISLFVINHTYANVNAVGPFAPKTQVGGGTGVKYMASARNELKVIEKIKDKKTDEVVGQKIQITCMKNKLTRAFRQASFIFDFTKIKIDKYSGLADLLVKRGIMEKTKVKIEGAKGGPRNGYSYEGTEFVDSDFAKLIEKNNWLDDFNKKLKEYDEANFEEIVDGEVDTAVFSESSESSEMDE